ncbi:hypothetical protein CDAR_122091 [Caerostris darwini]|uniref:Uncharacterized protein n=1 Tax=Caerostris darwini TaxID=1538125 RepID=A0AAV4NF16_9ARAC|nr:hypothetical protein CDAR_122091 [Caerostris darwini]
MQHENLQDLKNPVLIKVETPSFVQSDTVTNHVWPEPKPFLKQTKPNLSEKCHAFHLKRRKKHTLHIKPYIPYSKWPGVAEIKEDKTMIRHGNDTFLA